MWRRSTRVLCRHVARREYSRVCPPPAKSAGTLIRVSNHVARLGPPKEGPKPRQLLSLPPFPGHPLPGKRSHEDGVVSRVTAVSWVKYYFDGIYDSTIQSHFKQGLVSENHSSVIIIYQKLRFFNLKFLKFNFIF